MQADGVNRHNRARWPGEFDYVLPKPGEAYGIIGFAAVAAQLAWDFPM